MRETLVRIEKVIFFVFLLLIPTQLGKHFWPEWSYVLGIRVDYLSPTLYLIDIVWLALVILKAGDFKNILKKINFGVILAVILVGLNIFLAENWEVAGYKWLRIFQLIWTISYIRTKKVDLEKNLIYIIPCWIVIESLLGLGQVITGGSLNGWWYFLGERRFEINTIGIAQISLLGNKIMRAYGSFSHPNSLAAFLLVVWLIWVGFKNKFKIKMIGWWLVWWLGFLGIIVTGSRLIWLLLGVSLVIILLKDKKNKLYLVSAILIGISLIWVLINNQVLGGWDKFSLEKRVNLNYSAIKIIKDEPLGVGLGNFLVTLPDYQERENFWLQPVHNIPLLLITEIGLVELILWFWIINRSKLKFLKLNKTKLLIVMVIVVTSMFDHYWFTLPQNMWLLTIIIGGYLLR